MHLIAGVQLLICCLAENFDHKSLKSTNMKIAAVVMFAIAAILGIGGLIHASKPSYSPIVTVIGSFALPAIFTWWGVILWKKANAKNLRASDKSRADG